jgi:glycosyltransferase involved in cell wall biosynthesis
MYGGVKGQLARLGLGGVDRFICHSRGECESYSRWLKLPRERFEFVPLQVAMPSHADVPVDESNPFILAMGQARRDYATFFKAVEQLRLRAIVVAAPHAVEGLSVPKNVELRQNVPWEECVMLGRQARIHVVPVLNDETASGQITVVQAMLMRRPVVATRCMGTADYLQDGVTGLLVPSLEVDGMAEAIRRLWDDASLRHKLGEAAGDHAIHHFTDHAAGLEIARVLDDVIAARASSTSAPTRRGGSFTTDPT